ncbi:MAG: GntR family transcriptional regulator, partial [Comamonadaceae bacterium]
SLLEHRAVMEALLRRDKDATMQRMQAHFANGLEAAA